MNREKLTPMMQQYLAVKDENPDSILFFRLGDFYEMFFDDALLASRELEITLTRRDAGLEEKAPMCGVPYHVASSYISKLIDKGYKVAICDQVEDPKLAKGIVKREVTQIITPGTFTDTEYLKSDLNNYLLSIYIQGYSLNLTYSDYSTGEIYFTNKTFLSKTELFRFLQDQVDRISPNEILINEDALATFKKEIKKNNVFLNPYIAENLKDSNIIKDFGNYFSDNFKNNLRDFLSDNKIVDYTSLKKILQYLVVTQKINLKHINNISYYNNYDFLLLDESSKRTLEVVKGLNTFTKKGSLLDVLDKCSTSMGSRKLKKWVESPLVDLNKIEERQNIIESFTRDLLLQDKIEKILREVYDIERLVVKISNGSINPRELYSLKSTIENANKIKAILEGQDNKYLKLLSKEFIDLSDVYDEIDKVLIENPPVVIEENRIIKEGYSLELDELFKIATEGKNWLLDFEEKERNRTGIKKLKVKHNKILGYFIEVTKSFLDQVPEDYIRKQTLVGSERFFSMELKDMEGKLLGSKERALSMQAEIYNNLKDFIGKEIYRIQILADKLSKLDSLLSLAKVSNLNNYVRPKFNNEGYIEIKAGRHPIVESYMKDDFFVPNDTYIDTKSNMIHIITGPNMAGKSTYMRQVALITIMAHIGCFVPCDSCNISLIDRIFTRIGASDNLAMGQSTFMVEMQEVADIIQNASSKSLLILDEVGRGTSTFDGLAIANAIIEYIAENIKAKTLFATHYHELVHLEDKYDSVENLTIAVDRQEDDIIFLRKIIKGFTNNSYGIDVAKLAGIDDRIINRAKDVLALIEKENEGLNIDLNKEYIREEKTSPEVENFMNKLRQINILEISPMEAFNLLDEIVKKSKELI
ncbi:MAG: DNA mismatch repair protein MutS [Peptoniphilus harei]|uniref:DNA mismatch repair protein MutS n=1 Tax=Peptoniphilus harei ACS-146-V-Sch2b TaxID=908338 RepID=E4KYL3_9FIRM|nr:DNA mismatch repair protein MutS [Peptoniphilus harei]EFR33069.1 DNA mismatch repair protein MutS [Peptoniphilus harei ACS-146-V-Sch2b]MDK7354681.1 DNA mismatch repair protein MutS [Peptoniphilus harei]MDK7370444.1 DNA mismatch repair protein MutS [Peptoniphilus harei]MDK7376624.1 DNA mismatch repair protein MutS [Peptoniphilus harei]MDK7679242.1 DNA mismatch repair protein MutS [Peptoniphilus harei]